MEPRWFEGIVVGKKTRSDEYIILTLDGKKAVKARSIKLMLESESWDIEAIQRVEVTPWKLNVEGEKEKVPETVKFQEAEKQDEMKDPVVVELVPKDIYIRKQDYDDYGYSAGCPKCTAARIGKTSTRSHTPQCRERF